MLSLILESWPFFAVLSALAAVGLLLRSRRTAPAPPGYARRDQLLNERERSLFGSLQKAVGRGQHVLPKVRLGELLLPREDDSSDNPDHHRIDCSHVDFVVCCARSLKPQVVVQLDDQRTEPSESSGDDDAQSATDSERNEFVGRVLDSAGIPWFGFWADGKADVTRLRRLLRGRRAA